MTDEAPAPAGRGPRLQATATAHARSDDAPLDDDASERVAKAPRKAKPAFERTARTGRQKGFVPLFFNVGRNNEVQPSDLVGKIAGVTRQPAAIVGAIDIHAAHSIVDIAAPAVSLVCGKLNGVRIKGQVLRIIPASDAAND